MLALLGTFHGLALAKDPPEPTIRFLREAGPPERSVDVVFVGDGYSRSKTGKFWKDLRRYSTRLLKEPPFSWYRKKFSVRGLIVPSRDDGCDLSSKQENVSTVLESFFDSPSGRLLVFKKADLLKKLIIEAGDADIVFVMVNTEKYGGGGSVLHNHVVRGKPLPAPTFSARDTPSFLIALHELGHSFADLADEYAEDSTYPRALPEKGDLPHANVTLERCLDRSSFLALRETVKWKHFLELKGAKKHKWAHAGGYYRHTGVFRPWKRCMMRVLGDPFCPICAEEMSKAIFAVCGEDWDDAAYHKAHPLSRWK
ncbi:MAG: M64 family metallopeptidase [Planctomycetota bacterium]